jgi:hypothetical protein
MQTTPKLERFGIFCYKVLVWLFLGVVIGLFVAQLQGFMPIWFIAVHVLGAIGLGWLFIVLLFRYIDRKRARALAQDQAHASSYAAPARIDLIQFGGVRMMETRELTIIQVTVFPRSNAPYQTTVRQFMTAEDLDQLQEGALVTFNEDPDDGGYGTVLPVRPTGEIRTDIGTFKAVKIYPERRRTGLWLLVGRNPNCVTRSVSYILIFALFGIGFLSPYVITGNVDWLWLRMKYFPQKLIFQDKGNFNPEAFNKAYDKAIAYIGDRRIESLLFYKDFTAVNVERTDKAGHLRRATIRGNSVEAYFMPSSPEDQDRLFTAELVRYDVLKKALDDAAKDYDIEDIMYIGFRKDLRWSMPVPRERYVDVHIVFEGGETSLDYNGETGERLPD